MLEVTGVEADDVIATLATRAAADGIDVVVVTGDRDTYQLVARPAHQGALQPARRLRLRALRRGRHRRAHRASRPRSTPSTRRCAATRATTCPGVPGIGEKTAAKLVTTYGDLEGIFEHLDELPPKQRQNLGEARDRVFLNRQMSHAATATSTLGVEPGELAPGRVRPRAGARPVRPARVPHAAARGCSKRSATSAAEAAPRPTTLDVEVAVARDADAALERARELASKARARVAIEPRWDGAPGRERPLRRARGRDRRATSTYIDADAARATRRCATRSTALVGAGGPPLVAHRAKELMHGLGTSTCARSHHDTAVMAYLLDPGEGKYLARRPRAAVPLARGAVARRRSRARSTSTATSGVERDRPAGRGRCCGSPTRSARRSRRASSTDLYERFERPLVRVLAKMEDAGIRIDREFLDELGAELGDQCDELVREIHAHAGEEFNVNSTPQLRTHPVREARAHPGEEDEDRARRPTPTRSRRWPRTHPIVETCCATARSRSCAAPTPTRCRRSSRADGRIHATFKQTRHHHRPHLERGAEPAERAGAHRRTGARCGGRSSPTTAAGLLTADYSQIELRVLAHLAEDPGLIDAFERGADVHTDHRGAGVRRRRGRGRRVPAPLRQGRELRPRLRHGGVRARAAPRHPDRSGRARSSTPTSTASRTCASYMERDGARGQGSAATPPRSSAAAARSPSSRPTTSASARWGSAWRRTRRCRGRRPTSSSSR